MTDQDYDDFDDCEYGYDNTCSVCKGSGVDITGIFDCPECDGEGYRWWEWSQEQPIRRYWKRKNVKVK